MEIQIGSSESGLIDLGPLARGAVSRLKQGPGMFVGVRRRFMIDAFDNVDMLARTWLIREDPTGFIEIEIEDLPAEVEQDACTAALCVMCDHDLRNCAMRTFSEDGPSGFYEGAVGSALCLSGGTLFHADLGSTRSDVDAVRRMSRLIMSQLSSSHERLATISVAEKYLDGLETMQPSRHAPFPYQAIANAAAAHA